jgi:CBS domain-containing protein
MKVRDIMSPAPRTCAPDTTLAAAAGLMWEADCGILPVVAGRAVTGVITDRDICIALATKNLLASDVRVGQIATPHVATCRPEDDVHAALAIMKQKQVRRLPVVDSDGTVAGVLSMNDVVLAAAGAGEPVRDVEVIEAGGKHGLTGPHGFVVGSPS